jgi:hypothetical protein
MFDDKPNVEDGSIRVRLSDGTVVLMDYNNNNEPHDGEVSVQGLMIAAEKTFGVIKSLATDIKEQVKAAKPNRASIEFSIELEKKGGDILSKICNASGKGSVKIKLEWDFDKEEA